MSITHRQHSKAATALLWTAQGLLAALFLFAGVMKLVLPVEAMTAQAHLPGLFLRFIGVCETLGALGLVLPGLVHIREELTPLAARGLVVIMAGAVGVTLAGGQVAGAVVPLVVGLVAAAVAHGRAHAAAHDRAARRPRSVSAALLHPAR